MSAMLKMILNQFGLTETDVTNGLEKFNEFVDTQKALDEKIDKVLKVQGIIAALQAQLTAVVAQEFSDNAVIIELEQHIKELQQLIKPDALGESQPIG